MRHRGSGDPVHPMDSGTEVSAATTLVTCPFCHGVQLNVRQKWRGQFRTYFVECRDCDCRGPERDTRDAGINAWNERVGGTEYERGKGDGMMMRQASYQREYRAFEERIDRQREEMDRLGDLLGARDSLIADLKEEVASLKEPEA